MFFGSVFIVLSFMPVSFMIFQCTADCMLSGCLSSCPSLCVCSFSFDCCWVYVIVMYICIYVVVCVCLLVRVFCYVL